VKLKLNLLDSNVRQSEATPMKVASLCNDASFLSFCLGVCAMCCVLFVLDPDLRSCVVLDERKR